MTKAKRNQKIKLKHRSWELPEHKVIEFFPKRTKYCTGVPVLNEGERIRKQLRKMRKYSRLADIIIIDGGSTDGSTEKKFLEKQNVRALILSPRGQAVQLRAGLSWALKQDYEGIITVDGNNKDDIRTIPRFIKALDEGFDYIQGSRYMKGGKHKNTPLYRELGARLIISPVLSLGAGKWYTETTNAFRAYSRKYLLHPQVKPFRSIFRSYDLLFYLVVRANRLGLKTKEIPVTRNYPKGEVPTKITGLKVLDLVLTALKAALGYYNP